jgi:hypothetical protein
MGRANRDLAGTPTAALLKIGPEEPDCRLQVAVHPRAWAPHQSGLVSPPKDLEAETSVPTNCSAVEPCRLHIRDQQR